ncbi:MAG TPA: methyltransferase domain-containing protein [Steroidobacteraceae bacterium]|jgi:trans-aconitate 2-methyltransferase|nr:methyltransferase domain-containing protein [Steroidobacteraceae bacterium]
MSWNPEQYLRFSQPRLRPAIDLLGRIALDSPQRIYDLGCGAGNVTALLRARWPAAALTGVDSSAAMLEKAATALPHVSWLQQSLDQWRAEAAADLIFSNAALHWLGDHEHLFPRLLTSLRAGGVLAVQMPRNFAAPSHTLIADTVRAGPWRSQLESLLGPPPVSEPAFYYSVLAPLSQTLDIWETEYLQVLSGEDPVKEWTKGTALIPYLQRLSPAQHRPFESDYAQRLRTAYPRRADGTTLFPFKRLFILLQRK